jgi:hypothetical protein
VWLFAIKNHSRESVPCCLIYPAPRRRQEEKGEACSVSLLRMILFFMILSVMILCPRLLPTILSPA